MKQKSVFTSILFLLPFLLPGCRMAPSQKLSPDIVESRIRTVFELPLYEQRYHDIVYVGEEARFFGIKHIDTKLLFSIDIRIQAGIDLLKEISVLPAQDGSLVVLLPEPEILLVDADESTIREYFLKEHGKAISRLDYYDEIEKGKDRVRQEAIERGIIEKSKELARDAVGGLFASDADRKINVRFRSQAGKGEEL